MDGDPIAGAMLLVLIALLVAFIIWIVNSVGWFLLVIPVGLAFAAWRFWRSTAAQGPPKPAVPQEYDVIRVEFDPDDYPDR